MERKKFYSALFYNKDYETVAILDQLHDANLLCVTEYYRNGTILSLEATDCTEVRELLAPMILDMDAYIEENNATFTSSEKNIPLNLLAMDYEEILKEKITWDDQIACFFSY